MRGREENIVGIFFRQIFAETTEESGQVIDLKTVFLAVFQNKFIDLQRRHVLFIEICGKVTKKIVKIFEQKELLIFLRCTKTHKRVILSHNISYDGNTTTKTMA